MEKTELKSLLNKIFVCLIAILTVLIINTMILGASLSNKTVSNDNNEVESLSYDISKLKEISAEEIVGETKNSNTVVYVGRESCSWCVKFMGVLNQAIDDYKLDALYIDIAKLIDFGSGSIIDQVNYDIMLNLKTLSSLEGYMEENFGATPMVLIIKDGKIIDAQTGYVETDAFNKFLNKNDFMIK